MRRAVRSSVRAALETYLTHLRREGRPDAAREAQWRFKAAVYNDPFAELELEKVTKQDFREWRDRVRPGRTPRTVNRYTRAVRAGLNCAIDLGHVGNPAAWKVAALSDDIEDEGETAVFLSADQRKALIGEASPPAAAFFRGLELTGARPKELAAAVVSSFDGKSIRLAHRKGRPPKLRARLVVLSADGVKFFERQTGGKLPGTPIFTEDGEQPWRRHIWAREFRAAADEGEQKARGKSRVPNSAGTYSFRHARISELLQLHGVDPLTVAAQTGTSLAMIEKAYFRFIPSAMHEKLAAVQDAR